MLSDSRGFSRNLAVLGLIAGPLLLFIGSAVSPVWGDETAEYLSEVAANQGAHRAASALFLLAGIAMLPGVLGAGRLLRSRRVTLGQIASGMVALGVLSMAGWYAISVMDLAMVDEARDRAEMIALSEAAEDSGGAVPFFAMFILGIVLGNLLLAAALLLRKAVPVWAPTAIVLSMVTGFAAGDSQVGSLVGFALLTVGYGAIAMRIRGLTNEQWGAWAPLEAEKEQAPAPVAAAEA